MKLYKAFGIAIVIGTVGVVLFAPETEPQRVSFVQTDVCVPKSAYVLSNVVTRVNEIVAPECL
jgi:hypothetical protein